MKIFDSYKNNTISQEGKDAWYKILCLRDRCAKIICTAWSFGSQYRDLVIEECELAGFKEIDEDDFLHLSDYANLNGEDLFRKERKLS